MENQQYIGIDLCAGVGGLSTGLSRAGFNMKLGIERDPKVAYNLKVNNKKMNVVISDIRRLNPIKIVKESQIDVGNICLVASGLPCQGFSQSNRRSRSIDNPLNNLYKHFFRFIKAIKPHVFLLENVAGLKTLHKGSVFNDILRIGKRLNYCVQHDIINAVDYGVPQKRKRILFIGTKNKIENLFKYEKCKIVTVREAFSDLPILENGNKINELNYYKYNTLPYYQKKMRINNNGTVQNNLVTKNGKLVIERYKYIPQGGNWQNIPKRLMLNYCNLNNCHSWIYYRLPYDEPSIVINNFRKNMLIHPEQNRGLSVREAARLQSFPDNYIFYGDLGYQQQQVADAFPPLLAEKIGRKIIEYLREIRDE